MYPKENRKLSEYRLTTADLTYHLREQLAFLKASGQSYDGGFEGEARRLAVTIRILIHDTPKSTSLLTQLQKKDILFYNLAKDYRPNNQAGDYCLVIMRLVTGQGAKYVPMLHDSGASVNIKKVSFDDWWNKVVIKDAKCQCFTRKDLVLTLANKEGGAHIDPQLGNAYAALTKFNSMGWRVSVNGEEKDLDNSLVCASIRQISYEMLKTMSDAFPDLVL